MIGGIEARRFRLPECCYCSYPKIVNSNLISTQCQYCMHHHTWDRCAPAKVPSTRYSFANINLSNVENGMEISITITAANELVTNLHNDAIGRPDRPQCSNLSVFSEAVSIDLPKLIAFVSDNGVPRVVNICNAWLRFTILMHACHPRFVILRFSEMSISLVAS